MLLDLAPPAAVTSSAAAPKKPRTGDERWFVVEGLWYRRAEAFRLGKAPRPPPLDNRGLLLPLSLELRPRLTRGLDFDIIPEEEYLSLAALCDPPVGPVIETKSTASGSFDIFHLALPVHCANQHGEASNDSFRVVRFAPETTVQHVYDELCKPVQGRLWVKSGEYAEFVLVDLGRDGLLQLHRDKHWTSATQLLVEVPPFAKSKKSMAKSASSVLGTSSYNALNSSLASPLSSTTPSAASTLAISRLSIPAPLVRLLLPLGVRGLVNLGNTCWLASVMQILLHTQSLSARLLSGQALKQINTDNPLGRKGAVVGALTTFFREVWSRQAPAVVNPAAFKRALDQWTSLFREHKQHDAQEALSFLLDELHEDTLRSGDRGSVARDVFGGMLATTMRCPSCGHGSTTQEHFSMLSLELPRPPLAKVAPRHMLAFFPAEGNEPRRIAVPFVAPGIIDPKDVAVAAGVSQVVLARVRRTPGADMRIDVKDSAASLLPAVSEWELVAYERPSSGRLLHVIHRQDGKPVGCPQIVGVASASELRAMLPNSCKISVARMNLPPTVQGSELTDEALQRAEGLAVLVDWPSASSSSFRVIGGSGGVGVVPRAWNIPAMPVQKEATVSADGNEGPVVSLQDSSSSSLQSCLNHFLADEILDEANKWECESCHERVAATRSTAVAKSPNWLLLHLKRFRADGSKIRDVVAHGSQIGLRGKEYVLHGLIRHHGPLASSGHYTAVVKSNVDQNFRTINDENVSAPLKGAPVNESDAFVFLFRAVEELERCV